MQSVSVSYQPYSMEHLSSTFDHSFAYNKHQVGAGTTKPLQTQNPTTPLSYPYHVLGHVHPQNGRWSQGQESSQSKARGISNPTHLWTNVSIVSCDYHYHLLSWPDELPVHPYHTVVAGQLINTTAWSVGWNMPQYCCRWCCGYVWSCLGVWFDDCQTLLGHVQILQVPKP